jgi:solute carrier family 25 (mitochondrial carnitine/acylcarnitine transporter), member 20/29
MFGPTVSYTAVRMITFDWYNKMKYNIDDAVFGMTGKSILVHVNTIGTKPTFLSAACFTAAGATTGFFVSFLACPFELLKVAKQMSGLMAVTQEASAKSAAQSTMVASMKPSATAVASVATAGGGTIDAKLSRSYRDKGTFGAGYDLYKRVGIRGLYSGIHLHASKCIAAALHSSNH